MRLALRKLSGLVNHSTEPSSRVDTPPGRRSCFRHRKRPRLRGAKCMKKPGFWGAMMGEVSTSSCWKRPTPFLFRKSSSFLGGWGWGENQIFPKFFWTRKFHRRLFKTKPLLSFSLKELGLVKLHRSQSPQAFHAGPGAINNFDVHHKPKVRPGDEAVHCRGHLPIIWFSSRWNRGEYNKGPSFKGEHKAMF